MASKKTVEDLTDIKGKKVLVRCDLNVPLDGKKITDDTRIRSSMPTIELLKKFCNFKIEFKQFFISAQFQPVTCQSVETKSQI